MIPGMGKHEIRSIIRIMRDTGEKEYSRTEVGVRLMLNLVISLTPSVTH